MNILKSLISRYWIDLPLYKQQILAKRARIEPEDECGEHTPADPHLYHTRCTVCGVELEMLPFIGAQGRTMR